MKTRTMIEEINDLKCTPYYSGISTLLQKLGESKRDEDKFQLAGHIDQLIILSETVSNKEYPLVRKLYENHVG